MKYKCMKCGTVFDASFEVKCPKCKARDWDCMPFYGATNSQVEKSTETSVPVAKE